jgi:hypothetical protein
MLDGPDAVSWTTDPLSRPNEYTFLYPLGNRLDYVRVGGREYFGKWSRWNGTVCKRSKEKSIGAVLILLPDVDIKYSMPF